MDQTYRSREAVAPTFDTDAATLAFMNNRVRKGKMYPTEKAMLKNILKVGKYFINPQLARVPVEGKRRAVLNPINKDEAIAKKLNVSTRQVKSIRMKMAELNIIFLPPTANDSKRRAVGPKTLPCWMLNFDFMIDEDFLLKQNPDANTVTKDDRIRKMAEPEIENEKKRGISWDKRYTPFLVNILKEQTADLNEQFDEDEEMYGTPRPTAGEFVAIRWKVVCGLLMDEYGTTVKHHYL